MILVVGLAIGISFVLRYAERVRADPSRSVVYAQKEANEAHFLAEGNGSDEVTFTGTHKVVLTVFALAFVVMIYGVIPWEDLGIGLPTWWWWFPEMTASFLLFSIIIGLIGADGRGGADHDVRRRCAGPARRRADHRHRARHHGAHEQRPDHRHGAALGRAGRSATRARRRSRS